MSTKQNLKHAQMNSRIYDSLSGNFSLSLSFLCILYVTFSWCLDHEFHPKSPSFSVSAFSRPQTILGDFQKEQEKFVQEKNAKKTGKRCINITGLFFVLVY